MSAKLTARTLRAVVAARTRLRDAAAAIEATADGHHTRAAAATEDAQAHLDDSIDRVRERIPLVSSIHDVERMTDEITGDRAAQAEAEQHQQQAAAALERANVELRLKARQLRSMEKALDTHLEARESTQARDEQRQSDDLGSRPRNR